MPRKCVDILDVRWARERGRTQANGRIKTIKREGQREGRASMRVGGIQSLVLDYVRDAYEASQGGC